MAPIVIETMPASDQLSDTPRRGFADMIATLAARLTEKNVPVSRATQLATHAWTSVEGALILSRLLHSPEPFDLAIAHLAFSLSRNHLVRANTWATGGTGHRFHGYRRSVRHVHTT